MKTQHKYLWPLLSLAVAFLAYLIPVWWRGGDLCSLWTLSNAGHGANDHRRLPVDHNSCLDRYPILKETLENKLALDVHHNGNAESCASVSSDDSLVDSLSQALQDLGRSKCPSNKYEMEAFLTLWMHHVLQNDACGAPTWFDHCDAGIERTVVHPNHEQLVHVPHTDHTTSLPCRFFTREGLRITSIAQLEHLIQCNDDACSLALYAAPAGRVFMFAPSYVGEIFELNHVRDAQGQTLALKVLSLEPRVFDIYNFFSKTESQQLIDKALTETKEEYKLHRSTTGTVGHTVFNKRTSENAWDTMGALAQKIKRRAFLALGLDDYHESMSDGLQILRYNLTTAYVPHMDALDDMPSVDYNYDPSTWGGNRFATILLYMSDLPENGGGETVFVEGWPAEGERLSDEEALERLRSSGDADFLTKGSWEETMVAQCRSRLAVRPNASRAVLFYSQHPDGRIDKSSRHGGCPVLKGTKWAANLWVWNAPRPEFDGRPLKRGRKERGEYNKVHAVFRNSGKNPAYDRAELYFEGTQFFGKLGPGDPPVPMNTYRTHEWHIIADGKLLEKLVIDGKEAEVEFVF